MNVCSGMCIFFPGSTISCIAVVHRKDEQTQCGELVTDLSQRRLLQPNYNDDVSMHRDSALGYIDYRGFFADQ